MEGNENYSFTVKIGVLASFTLSTFIGVFNVCDLALCFHVTGTRNSFKYTYKLVDTRNAFCAYVRTVFDENRTMHKSIVNMQTKLIIFFALLIWKQMSLKKHTPWLFCYIILRSECQKLSKPCTRQQVLKSKLYY